MISSYDLLQMGVDPDEEPEIDYRCDCGAFLPKEPTIEMYVCGVKAWEITHTEDGPMPVPVEFDYEPLPTWTCAKCGRSFLDPNRCTR